MGSETSKQKHNVDVMMQKVFLMIHWVIKIV